MVVLRHEGGTVNFSGLEITKTRKGFEVKKQFRPCGIPFESLRVGKLEELASATPLVVISTPTFAQPSENSSSRHLGDQTCCKPCLVGDFNVEPTQIPSLAKGTSAGLWVDLEATWAFCIGRKPAVSCKRT